jgi:ketosteroid isomerase-like protein
MTATDDKKENDVTTSLREAITQSNILYGKAFMAADSSLFIDRYDVNAWIMAPNVKSFTGPNAAAKFYTIAHREMKIRNVILTTTELYSEEDFATELGSFELRGANNEVLNKGKYLVLWKNTSGQWKMYRDCFNSDEP